MRCNSDTHPARLKSMPQRPREKRAGGSGAPNSRRQSTQPILRAYVRPIAPLTSPAILFQASSLPIRMTEKMTVIDIEAIIALTGSGVPWSTVIFWNQWENGKPMGEAVSS